MSMILFTYLPLALLIYLMAKKNAMAAARALPLCAVVAYLIALWVFERELVLLNANVISGMLLALTPISIIAGAIFLFRCMEVSGALDTLKTWLDGISQSKVAQLMIIGWALAFLIEGASGFGTPAAIAAPILFSLGFPALRVAIFCLILNTIPVTFGAVGTPMWFGLGLLNLSAATIREVAWQAALISTLCAPIIVVCALRLVLGEWQSIKQNFTFVLCSVFSCTLPYLLLSTISIEFPSLAGGAIGLIITILLARFKIGLCEAQREPNGSSQIKVLTLLKATFPLWATVLILILTRIPALGLKSLLQLTEPGINIDLSPLGQLHVSAALKLELSHILGSETRWHHALLYVPSIVPFFLVGVTTLRLYGMSAIWRTCCETGARLPKPFLALMGALVFVNMMMFGENTAPVITIGQDLAGLTGAQWPFFASLLGALGSFFSGSATISNLTFAAIQASIAEQLSLPLSTILALQSVGAAMGNMVCINNIVAVTAILGLQKQDGVILKITLPVLLVFAILAGLAGILLLP